ncbi:BQ5605_C010g06167 [Microbotryum silenes-dioicae]|uniref:BQ5605_C010g06167 protein n=1 Tax=Microbotryum silenes-dioicae TaxID=796604 RepID=A0A2X0LV85_9BASI|nr:BQ5605_C010g06167 [Microbotryum silenes-dioicae]
MLGFPTESTWLRHVTSPFDHRHSSSPRDLQREAQRVKDQAEKERLEAKAETERQAAVLRQEARMQMSSTRSSLAIIPTCLHQTNETIVRIARNPFRPQAPQLVCSSSNASSPSGSNSPNVQQRVAGLSSSTTIANSSQQRPQPTRPLPTDAEVFTQASDFIEAGVPLCDGGGGELYDGDEDEVATVATKGSERWKHPAWLQTQTAHHLARIRRVDNYSNKARHHKSGDELVHGFLPVKSAWTRLYDGCISNANLDIYEPQFFYWDPLLMIGQPDDKRAGVGLRLNGFLDRPRRACGLREFVYLIGRSYNCDNKKCSKTYRSWSPEVLDPLDPSLRSMFPSILRSSFHYGLGAEQISDMLVCFHRGAHDRLELDYRSAIYVPTSKVLAIFFNAKIEEHESLIRHHVSLAPCTIMSRDHSCKLRTWKRGNLSSSQVPKQIAKINGIPPFHALLMVGNEYGKVRLAVLTATKGHASFESPLEDMSKHLKLYGHEQPSICYTDQPGQDTTFLIETLPSRVPVQLAEDDNNSRKISKNPNALLFADCAFVSRFSMEL